MKKTALFLCLICLILVYSLSSCTVLPPQQGGITDVDTTKEQDIQDQTTISTDTTQADTDISTESDTENQETTYGPLHFPESDAQ